MKIAIIDIGSNAIKYKIFDKETFEIEEYVREPLRLGTDVFTKGYISQLNIHALIELLNRYQKVFSQKNIKDTHYIATSAVRDANNKLELVEALENNSIKLNIISGEEEAKLLSNFRTKVSKYAVVDIGGGSLEIFINDGEKQSSKSFQLGAVRLLNSDDQWADEEIAKMKLWLSRFNDVEVLYGLGGNLRSLFEVSGIQKSIPAYQLEKIVSTFKTFSQTELVERYSLPKDRADIAPVAALLYQEISSKLNVKTIENSFWSISNGIFKKIINEIT